MFTTNALLVITIAIIIIVIAMFENDNNGIKISLTDNSKVGIRPYYLFEMLLFLFFGTCVKDSYDLEFYQDAFERRVSHGKEPLFDVISYFFHDTGVSFECFKFIWLAVITVLLCRGINQFTKKPEQVVALTFFLVLISFITQMRSAMALALILNFIPLLYTGKIRDRVIYGIIVLLCGQFHIAAYVYVLFIIVGNNTKRSYKLGYFVILGIVTMFIVVMNVYFVSFLTSVFSHIPGISSIAIRVIESVSGDITPVKASIFLICEHVVLYILTEKACRLQMKDNSQEKARINVISEINTLSLIFVPVCILNASYTRIFNPIMLIQYGMILNVGQARIGLSDSITLDIKMKALLICFTIFVVAVTVHSNPDDFVRIMNSIQL